MNREGLLKSIAETGYNVGFGAKKNFATHDIVQKTPGFIGFVSLAVGVYALICEPLNSKWIAATLVVLGMTSLGVSLYDHEKVSYDAEGNRLTGLFYRLRDLYWEVRAMGDSDDLTGYREQLRSIEKEFLDGTKSKQILFSDWYAHYKFFRQFQIDWINEQKQFKFWRDKVPLSLLFVLVLVALAVVALVATGALCAVFPR